MSGCLSAVHLLDGCGDVNIGGDVENRSIGGLCLRGEIGAERSCGVHTAAIDEMVAAVFLVKEIDIISNMYDVSDTSFEKLQDVRTMLLNSLPSTKTAKKMGWCNESKYGNGPWPTWVVKERLVQLIKGVSKEHPMWADLVDILEKYYGSMDVEKLVSESKEQVKVEFKKTPEDGEVIAFFPDTAKDGSCNPGMIMSYMHVGQHGEASVEFYNDCTTCMEEDYADLLAELEKVYDDCELVVVE